MRTNPENKPKLINVDDDAQVDRFNEVFTEVCKKLGVHRETEAVPYEQAANVLGVATASIIRYAYSEPPALRKVGRGLVSLDDVVQRLMLVGRREK